MPQHEWLVYWLFDDKCTDFKKHGLVGATKSTRLYPRMNQHKHSKRIPKDFQFKILFRGTQKTALAFEAKLRSKPYIGWNVGIGGFANGGGTLGIPKSPEHRAKIKAAALVRYTDLTERERSSSAVKKALKGVDRSGANNHRFGKPMSEETKDKIRQRITANGGRKGSNNPNYRD